MIRRWLSHPIVDLALKALSRNRLQTGLTMLGMMVGVATVLAMMAVGAGAQQSIEQQVRAAGLNQLTVRAGNWRPKVEDTGEAIAHGDARDTLTLPALPGLDVPGSGFRSPASGFSGTGPRVPDTGDVLPASFHPEDDPMEKHDHPLARQRLGDLEAGLGSAATLSFADAEAIKTLPGVQYVAGGVHENARVHLGDKRWFTRMHGTDVEMPSIKRGWMLSDGRFFTRREQDSAAQVIVIGQIVADKLFGPGKKAVGQEVMMWNQPFEVVGVVTSSTWVVQPAPGDDQFDAVYMPYTTTHRLLNLSKLNDITITAASSGQVTTLARDITALLRQRHGIGDNQPDDFTVLTQATKALTTGGLPPSVARAVAGNVAELEKVTLEQLATTLERASRTMTWLLAAVAAVSLRGRRHRHHEHHAAVGHRAHARDRPAPGRRRPQPRRDEAVPDRGRDHQPGRRRRRHHPRHHRRRADRAHPELGHRGLAACRCCSRSASPARWASSSAGTRPSGRRCSIPSSRLRRE